MVREGTQDDGNKRGPFQLLSFVTEIYAIRVV